MTTHNSRCLFLPAWFIQAQEAIYTRSPNDSENTLLPFDEFLFPLLTPNDVNGVIAVLDAIQGKLFSSPSSIVVTLPITDSFPIPMTHSKSKRAALRRFLSMLGGLKFYVPEKNKTYLAQTFFSKEQWTLSEGETSVTFTLTPHSPQLITGYQNSYENLLSSNVAIPSLAFQSRPLSLWKSIWLDLQGIEQLIWVRCESKRQWLDDAVQLNHVYNLSLPEVFKNLTFRQNKSILKPVSVFWKKIQKLSKIHKKLYEHGFLSPVEPGGGLYFGSGDGDSDQLVWHIHSSNMQCKEQDEYEKKVASYFTERLLHFFPNELANAFYPKDASLQSKMLQELHIEQLKKHSLLEKYVVVSGNQIIPLVFLFFEWSGRQVKDHPNPLPPEWARHSLIELTHPSQLKDNLLSKVAAFIAATENAPQFVEWLECVPQLTLLHPLLQNLQNQNHSVAKNTTNFRPQESFARDFAKKPIKSSIEIPKNLEEKTDSIRSENPLPSFQNVGTGDRSNLQGIAIKELKTIKEKSQEEYIQLQKSFLASLTEEAKELISNIQEKMHPEVFQEHLEKRLVKYMIENPSSWRSFSASLH